MTLQNTIDLNAIRQQFDRNGNRLVVRMAEFTAARAWAYAPVDTGTLRNSIHVVYDNMGMIAYVAVDAPYSVYVEYGHRTHSVAGAAWIPANPFLRSAIADAIAEFPRIVPQVWAWDNIAAGGGRSSNMNAGFSMDDSHIVQAGNDGWAGFGTPGNTFKPFMQGDATPDVKHN